MRLKLDLEVGELLLVLARTLIGSDPRHLRDDLLDLAGRI